MSRLIYLLLAIFLILFPIVFFTGFTDPIISKEILLGGVVCITLILLGIQNLSFRAKPIRQAQGKLREVEESFLHQIPPRASLGRDDRLKNMLPLAIFTVVLLISSLFSLHRADSLVNWSWYFFAFLFSWIITYSTSTSEDSSLPIRSEPHGRRLAGHHPRRTYVFFSLCLIFGIIMASILHILAFFSLPAVVPLSGTRVGIPKNFTPLGSLIDHAVILIGILPLILSFRARSPQATESKNLTDDKKYLIIGYFACFIIILSLLLAIYELFFIAKPLILPAFMGLRIATNEMLHDSARYNSVPGFLFGSGPGTFPNDFTRFKPKEINFDPTLWNVNFVNSSSFFLELLATTGIVGALAYLGIAVGIIKMIISSFENREDRYRMVPVGSFLIFLASLFLPVSYTTIAIMFMMIGLSSVKHEALSMKQPHPNPLLKGEGTLRFTLYTLPYLILSIVLGFYLFRYCYSDILFAQSLNSENNNNAQQTYQKQLQAIKLFPYRDIFYRSFSQTSLYIGKTISLKVSQNNGLALFQQAISSAKTATNLSPLSAANWQNLAAIYRSLNIKGADSYAITSTQQALLLDPNNPQEYMNLGGTYYQLALWDDAIKQFSSAIRLKPDFPNAYYNRGHAYEQKGNFKNALKDYQKASDLVFGAPQAKKQIDNDINILQNKMTK